jgi:homoserine dehydrogenase
VRVREEDVHVEGIDSLQPVDIQFARELGYVIKLLAIAARIDGQLVLRVHPTLVHRDDVLAEVSGSFNAISVYGSALGHVLFYGRGAGQMPTASAVVADLVGVAQGTIPLAFKQLNIFPDGVPPARVQPIEELQSRYYLRVLARDVPGVMAQVANALAAHHVSLSAILQREAMETSYVPVVITTHLVREGSIRAALRDIDALPTIIRPSACLRVIDQPKEYGEA